ncbi:MAG: type II secretion system protein [Candidatus Muiribacteriaceae bacterium]
MVNRKAFTFVEIVVAIGIIIVMSGGALLYLPAMSEEAKASALKANLNTLRKVIDDYYSDFGTYPATLRELTYETPGGYVYLRGIPEDPTTGMSDWEVSEDGVTYYEMEDDSYSFVRYVRSGNGKYKDY